MKPKLSVDELISHMQAKGIKFNIVSTEKAREFLCDHNYYMKLASYRTNFNKCNGGKRDGQYQNLEFAYLQELSTIDMHLRYIILQMCLDIEHNLKVRLINHVSGNQNEDGYKIVKEYLKSEDPKFNLLHSIYNHKSGEYCKDLIDKYYPYFPIWVLVELITFGDLLHICQFYSRYYHCDILNGITSKFFNTVRDLRNAAAHSNCLMNKMTAPMDASKQPDYNIIIFTRSLCTTGEVYIPSHTRNKNLHINFVYNMITLLYVYDQLMPSSSKCKRYNELKSFMEGRVIENKRYFTSNTKLVGIYDFLKKIIDSLASKG